MDKEENSVLKIIDGPEGLTGCDKHYLDYKLWGTEYDSDVYGQVAYISGQGIMVRLTAEEKPILRKYTKEDDPVYLDSAMEFFLNCNRKEGRYLNIEVNSNGAFLSRFGSKEDRNTTRDLIGQVPCVSVSEDDHSWSVDIMILDNMLDELYGQDNVVMQDENSFGMYKICESEGPYRHFVSLIDIPTEKPDFHVPWFFKKLSLER